LDLELAIIHEAYEDEYTTRIQSNERLAAIGQVAGGIAHELRNPLNAVKTSAYYLTNARNPSPEKTAEHLSRIDRQVTLADAVVTTLSDFAKLPVPQLKPMVLAECIEVAFQNHQIPDTIQLSLALPESLPPVEADSTQIQIVFGNLIRNAQDAMPEGGRLEITAHRDDDSVAIAFADTGVGIAFEDLGKIMEPLFSTKARGIGLGLAITRAILDKHNGDLLDKHNGDLLVESEPDKGSTFTVTLKAAEE
jgi:signal transduction histidine kinase